MAIAKKKRIILIGYNIASRSLKNLQANLKEKFPTKRVLRVKRTSPTYKRRISDNVFNWGPCLPSQHVNIAQEQAKLIANNKLKTFQKFKEHGVCHPEWTVDKELAQQWIEEGHKVVVRTLLCSHSGKGIFICDKDNPLVNGKLYVKYKKKKHEFRVHVFNQKVIDFAQKKKRVGHENRNNQIRNHQNGWVYCRENVIKPEGIEQLALDAMKALGLNVGAVDIIYNEKENKCYVLEVNTAPGIEGITCENYSKEFANAIN